MKFKTDHFHSVITRFPPSPTGPLHLGNVRTALFNYLFAKQNNGAFVVRVEDTDRARSEKKFETAMLNGLEWLGLERDGELWHQSERGSVYSSYINKLIKDGYAYISTETTGENKEVVRFKNPKVTVTFTDIIRGEVSFDTTELGDFVIARNISEPVYHLAVVIDDFETGVTHIIRGEDHISNTPRQLLIADAIGAPRPKYAHLPLLLASDKSKLSKRKHGESVSLQYYQEKGYLPSALINYMALLGWNPGTEQEIFTLEELIKNFSLNKVQKSGAVFNVEKLNWINKEHIKLIPEDEIKKHITSYLTSTDKFKNNNWDIHREMLPKLSSIILERINVWSDINALVETGELDWAYEEPKNLGSMIFWKNEKDSQTTKAHLEWVIETVKQIISENWNAENLKNKIMPYAEKTGKGSVLWPLRVALSGKDRSPDPFTLLAVLGKEESIRRIQSAIAGL
jgi:glutamyl-tRNA synthetase